MADSVLAGVSKPAPDAGHRKVSPVEVSGLKTEHLREPLGVETPHPRFRWLLESNDRGQLQAAYQVLVASSVESLRANVGDLWDSGKVISDNSIEVSYAGRALVSGERAYWAVRVWDKSGRASPYSVPSFFEMGLLESGEWHGNWIAANPDVSSPLFRREFSLNTAARRARVYVSGLGYYELYCNGHKVGNRVLEPASTYYHNDQPYELSSRILYATYDVTTELRSGANALGLVLGNGWYSSEVFGSDERRVRRVAYGDRPKLILQMNVELADGRTFKLSSDASWKTHSGPITYNDLDQGESYDARLELPGWERPGFDDRTWESASVAERPGGVLTAELLPPTQVVATLPAVKAIAPRVAELFDDVTVYDFGQNFSGWVRLAVSGQRGSKVVLRYGARLFPEDDTLDTRSNEPPLEPARQTDTYILKGDATEVWEPRFTLHGFRFVEVQKGYTSPPVVHAAEGRFVRSALETIGTWTSSNELLNSIHHNIHWTLMSSLQGIPQDAAERAERVAYLGDAGFVAEDYLANYDMVSFWEKWLKDIQDCQNEKGSITAMCPNHWRVPYVVWPSSESAYPLIVWYLYEYYGDRGALAEHYGTVKRLVDSLTEATVGHLFASEYLGDHMEPQDTSVSSYAPHHTPSGLSASAYYYWDLELLSRMAAVLGHSREVKHYQVLARAVRAAFNRQFFHPATHQYATGSQTSNALALYFGLVPYPEIPEVVKSLVEDITLKHGTHVSTGIIGSNAIVEVLPERGEADLMYRLATQTSYPSLGEQVMKGATTVCENYECDPWLSQNMKMFASLDKFLYRNLAGIHLVDVGFRRVLIRPNVVGDLKQVTASQKTVRGTVGVEWSRGLNRFDLKVMIPAGMEGDIAIPKLGSRSVKILEGQNIVWKSDSYVPGTAGLTGAKPDTDAVLFHVGSGSYDFKLSGLE